MPGRIPLSSREAIRDPGAFLPSEEHPSVSADPWSRANESHSRSQPGPVRWRLPDRFRAADEFDRVPGPLVNRLQTYAQDAKVSDAPSAVTS